jgi:hypothetical protein
VGGPLALVAVVGGGRRSCVASALSPSHPLTSRPLTARASPGLALSSALSRPWGEALVLRMRCTYLEVCSDDQRLTESTAMR